MVLCGVLVLRDSSAKTVEASSQKSRETGALLFHERGCEHCHGPNGMGTDRAPSLATIGKQWKAAQIEKQIREGGKGMPPFGGALQPDQVKSLVDYLKTKKKMPGELPRNALAAAGQGSPQ